MRRTDHFFRTCRIAGLLVLLVICVACGDTFRPVAIPQASTPPNPGALHFVLVINDNGPANPGSSTRIDVAGDSNVSVEPAGLTPVHAGILPNGSRVYIVNAGEDSLTSFSLISAIVPFTTSLPPGSNPAFVAASDNNNVWVANSATGMVSQVSSASNAVLQTIAVDSTTSNPIALVATPDGKKLYSINQTGGSGGTGSVTSINVVDATLNGSPLITGTTPIWGVARSDSNRVYVLNSGSGTISVIDTLSDTILGDFTVAAGANYMAYDSKLNRIYITNPVANTLTAFSATADPPANPLFTVPIAANPVSVAPLPDGTRIYVGSVAVSGSTATSQVTVLNTIDGSVRTVIPLTSVATACTSPRFRLSMAAAASGARVYAANCDAGSTAIIRTQAETTSSGTFSADTLVLNMPAPASANTPTGGGNALPQNPVFILSGP